MDPEHPTPPPPRPQPDTIYFVVVGLLLLMIVVSMGILWYRERSRADDLQAQLEAVQGRQSPVFERLMDMQMDAVQPVRREDLFAQEMIVDGRPRAVLYISAEAGRRYGFAPGDLVAVGTEVRSPQDDPGPGPADPQMPGGS